VVQKQRTFKNYRELLAQERAETERKFMLKLLAREETENAHLAPQAGRPRRSLLPKATASDEGSRMQRLLR
jgi:hypothetical protein